MNRKERLFSLKGQFEAAHKRWESGEWPEGMPKDPVWPEWPDVPEAPAKKVILVREEKIIKEVHITPWCTEVEKEAPVYVDSEGKVGTLVVSAEDGLSSDERGYRTEYSYYLRPVEVDLTPEEEALAQKHVEAWRAHRDGEKAYYNASREHSRVQDAWLSALEGWAKEASTEDLLLAWVGKHGPEVEEFKRLYDLGWGGPISVELAQRLGVSY